MREVLGCVSLVECLAVCCFFTFVETTNVVSGSGHEKIHTTSEKTHSITGVHALMLEQNFKVFQKRQSGKRLRKRRRLPGTLFHGRRDIMSNHSKKTIVKESGASSGEHKPVLSKRDYFFAPASPYGQMMNSVDRRMFLVHRGERGTCS